MHTDFIIDFETFGHLPDGVLVDCALIPFVNDHENIPSFQELVSKGIKIKFNIKSQLKNRIIDKSVTDWWKEQSESAKQNIKASSEDVTLEQGLKIMHDFLIKSGVNQKTSQGWARGPAFDFSHYVTWIRNVTGQRDTYENEAIRFWKQRDIRTAIEANLGVRDMCETPLPLGTLDGFIAHDSIHDCAKDILMLLYSKRYAYGLEDVPSLENADPRSHKKH